MCGTELLQTLMETQESMSENKIQKEKLFSKIDALIEGCSSEEMHLSSATAHVHDHAYTSSQSNLSQRSHMTEHDYDVVKASEEIQAYIAYIDENS